MNDFDVRQLECGYRVKISALEKQIDTLKAKADLFDEMTTLLVLSHAIMTTHGVGCGTAGKIADLINNNDAFVTKAKEL